MQEKVKKFNGDWIPFKEVDWTNKEVTCYYLDTRFFHVKYSQCVLEAWEQQRIDLKIIDQYTLTEAEVRDMLYRYYYETGGDVPFRYLSLGDVKNWGVFKYLSIFRDGDGFLVFDRDHQPLTKEFLNKKAVNNESIQDYKGTGMKSPFLETDGWLSPIASERAWQEKHLKKIFPSYPNSSPKWQVLNGLIRMACNDALIEIEEIESND